MKCFLFWVFSAVVFFVGGLFASQFQTFHKCPVLGKLMNCEKKCCVVKDGKCVEAKDCVCKMNAMGCTCCVACPGSVEKK